MNQSNNLNELNTGNGSHEEGAVSSSTKETGTSPVASTSKSVSNTAITNGSLPDDDDASSKENCDSGQISDGAASNNNSDNKLKTKKKGKLSLLGLFRTNSFHMMKTRNYRL